MVQLDCVQIQLRKPLVSGRLYVTESEIMCGLNGGSSAKLYPQSGSAYVHPTTKQCNYSYTHPSTKQCSWSPNLSNYATKSELNELRDLIESSQGPTIVDSGTVSDAANAGKPVYVSISSCNYVVVTLLNPPFGYTDTATIYKGSSATLYSNTASYLYTQTFVLNSSGTQLTVSGVEYEDPDRNVNIRGFSWIAYR